MSSVDHVAAKRLDLLLQQRIDRHEIPGCLTRVWLDDQLVHSNELGWRDVERGLPVTEDTVYRLHSLTKPVTSIALMQCFEQGLVELDRPVSHYVPSWANLQVEIGIDGSGHPVTEPCERAMTVHDLLTHQAGLPPADPSNWPMAPNLAALVDLLAARSLMFQPGSRFSYGMSTDVVGRIVEIVSGQSFDRYLGENILGPLGMSDTGFGVSEPALGRLSALYAATPSGLTLVEDPTTSRLTEPVTYFSGGGGLVSTATDYARLARMLGAGGTIEGERIIGRKTLELMARNHLTGARALPEHTIDWLFSNYQGIGFGLGFGIMLDPVKAKLTGSVGEFFWTGAAGCLMFVDPVEDLVVLFMTQAFPDAATRGLGNPYGWRELRAAIYALLP